MTRVFSAALLFWILVGFHASTCLAQEGGQRASDSEARALFEAGREAFAAAEYERALEYFQRAYDLSGRPELLYNVGQSADRARRDALALSAYERFLAEVPESPYRAQATTRLEFLRAHAGDDDGAEAGDAAQAPPPAEAEPPEPDVLAATEATPRADTSEGGSRVGPWILLGGGAAIAVTGGVLLALGQSARHRVENAAVGTSWADVSGDYDSAAPLGNAGIAALAVGAVAAGVGLTLLVLSGDDDNGAAVEVTAGAQGLFVRGSF